MDRFHISCTILHEHVEMKIPEVLEASVCNFLCGSGVRLKAYFNVK